MPLSSGKRFFTAIVAALLVSAPTCLYSAAGNGGGKWTADLKGSKETKETSDNKKGKVTTTTTEESLDVKFQTKFAPLLDFNSSFSFSRQEDTASDAFGKKQDQVKADAGAKGQWWDVKLTMDQSMTSTDDPAAKSENDSTYSLDMKIQPEYKALPQLSYKLESSSASDNKAYQATLEHEFLKMVKLKVEAERDLTDNKGETSTSTQGNKFKGEMTFSRDFWTMWKFEATASSSREDQKNLDDSGLVTDRQDKVTNDYSTKMSNNPLKWIDMGVELSRSENKDLVKKDPTDVTDKIKTDVKLKPKPTKNIDLELGYTDERENTSGTESDTATVADQYNFSAKWQLFKLYSTQASYDRKNNLTNPADPKESTKKTRDDEYKWTNEVGLWKDQLEFKLDRGYKFSWEDGVKKSEEGTWDFQTTFNWEHIPSLVFKPSYSLKTTEDKIENKKDSEKKIEANAVYTINIGQVTEIKLDHTYKRTATFPSSSEPSTIQREDSSKVGVRFKDFLKKMSFETTFDRTATDKSLDDIGPEINYKYTMKYQWDILAQYKFSVDYEFTDNQLSEDDESVKTEFSAAFLKDKLDVSLSYDRTRKYGGAGDKEQTYLIELKGKL